MRFPALAAAIALCALAPASALAQASHEEPRQLALTHGGSVRSYLAFDPPASRSRGSLPPALIVLHGGGGWARQIMSFSGLNLIAARDGFVALYPQGLKRRWNDGRELLGRDMAKDDVGFLLAVLDDLKQKGIAIDYAAIGVVGISNGGFMAMRMACDAADRIAGIAAVTATMPADVGSRCRPPRAVPTMVINGTRDPLVPYDGGHVRVFGRARGAIWSTARTVEFWAGVNGCGASPRSMPLADRDPGDGTFTIRHDYQACSSAPVTLLEVQGGGHTWPGRGQYLPQALIGIASRDFDASEAIAAFFRSIWRRQ